MQGFWYFSAMSTKAITRVRRRSARYGPAERYESPPPAGMCMSVFAVVRQKGKKGVLIGLPRPDDRWPLEWLTGWRTAPEKELTSNYQQWRLPSLYLFEGEHPNEALQRIMEDQLGITQYTVSKGGPEVMSYYEPSQLYPGSNHWDLAFVYSVKIKSKYDPTKRMPRWWQELVFAKKKKDFRGKDYGWNEDFMRDLGFAEDLSSGKKGGKKAKVSGKAPKSAKASSMDSQVEDHEEDLDSKKDLQ